MAPHRFPLLKKTQSRSSSRRRAQRCCRRVAGPSNQTLLEVVGQALARGVLRLHSTTLSQSRRKPFASNVLKSKPPHTRLEYGDAYFGLVVNKSMNGLKELELACGRCVQADSKSANRGSRISSGRTCCSFLAIRLRCCSALAAPLLAPEFSTFTPYI